MFQADIYNKITYLTPSVAYIKDYIDDREEKRKTGRDGKIQKEIHSGLFPLGHFSQEGGCRRLELFTVILQSGLRFIAGINSYSPVKGIIHSIPTILNNKLILMHFLLQPE